MSTENIYFNVMNSNKSIILIQAQNNNKIITKVINPFCR